MVKGLTFKSVTIGFGLSIFWIVLDLFIIAFTGVNLDVWSTALMVLFLTLLVTAFLPKRFRLSAQESSVIYSILLISIVLPYNVGWIFLLQNLGVAYVRPWSQMFLKFIPSFWVPKDPSIIRGAFYGGVSVPWDRWIVPLLSLIELLLAYCFFLYFNGLLWRRLIIEHERLTFPFAQVCVETIKVGTSQDSKPAMLSFTKARSTWIGLIIGVAIYLTNFLNVIWPFIPGTTFFVEMVPSTYNILPNATTGIWFDPWIIAAAYLAPLDILLTTWVWFIIGFILIPVMEVWLGWIAPVGPVNSQRVQSVTGTDVFKTYIMGNFGALTGLALWFVVFNWRYLLSTIKAIFKRTPEVSEEPITYRTIWLGIIATSIVLLSIFIGSGVPPVLAIMILLITWVVHMGNSLIRANAGGFVYSHWNEFSVSAIYDIGRGFGYFPSTYTLSTESYTTGAFIMNTTGHAIQGSPMFHGLEAYKIAYDTKTKPREIFLSQIVILFLAIIIILPIELWACYTFGISRGFAGSTAIQWNINWRSGTMLQSGGWPAPPYWINFSAGIILTGILWFLRLRYPWFWLNPIGIVIPSVVWPPGPWSCFFFAWILKFVTFKIGGSKLYEKIVPVMIGLIIGAFLMIFLQGLTQAVISVSA